MCLRVFFYGFGGCGSSWDALGDAWGIRSGQLGLLWGILEARRGMARVQIIKHGVLWSWDFGNCCYFMCFILYFEEGVNHGKRTDDKTWCAMVMRVLELLIFHWFCIVV